VLKLADMGEARQVSAPPKRDVPPIPARNWAPPEVRNCVGCCDLCRVHEA
jgi:hypothetical protein